MSLEIEESDWKVFRQLRPIALDRFCWRVLDEIQQVNADTKRSTHERYLAVYDLIQRRDRELADALDERAGRKPSCNSCPSSLIGY